MNNFPKRKPTRLQGYDYSTPGAYFVTICIKDRKPILSKIYEIFYGTDKSVPYRGTIKYDIPTERQKKTVFLFSRKHLINIEMYGILIMPNSI